MSGQNCRKIYMSPRHLLTSITLRMKCNVILHKSDILNSRQIISHKACWNIHVHLLTNDITEMKSNVILWKWPIWALMLSKWNIRSCHDVVKSLFSQKDCLSVSCTVHIAGASSVDGSNVYCIPDVTTDSP